MSASVGTVGGAGMTSGARAVMDGADWRAALKAYGAFAVLIAVIDTANVFSAVHDRSSVGHPIAIIDPIIGEATSAIGFFVAWPIVYLAARRAPPRKGGWLGFCLVHPPASVLFSSLHIITMTLSRFPAYALVGDRYRGPLFEFLYEYRKDIAAYMIMAGLIWLFRALERQAYQKPRPETPMLDIKDGPRLIRSPVADIVALSSAGNYVQVILADGRRPLMRTTLAKVESELGTHGFVRTHRSWLVNGGRVRELTAMGSGDFVLRLEGGVEAPLSRRFRPALGQLGLDMPLLTNHRPK
jgi:hypothetical protein